MFRVLAYLALMTDVYPPFRLDQGATQTDTPPATTAERPPLATSGHHNQEN
jgi:hypothetical protein